MKFGIRLEFWFEALLGVNGLRTFVQKTSNIGDFMKLLPQLGNEILVSEM